MKSVYIPQHLYPVLKKADFQAKDLRDVEKLLSTLSADDVAFYFYANSDHKSCPIPKAIQDTLPNFLFNHAEEGVPFTDTPEAKAVLDKMKSLKVNGTAATMYEDDAVLTSDCGGEDLLILTHVSPTDTDAVEDRSVQETALYDRIVQQLLVFLPLEKVVTTPLMAGWMKSVQSSA